MTQNSETENHPARARLLIVDDHPLVRAGLSDLIGNEPDLEICGEATGQGDALTLVKQCNPDLAIIDISLNNGDGMDLIKHIAASGSPVRMLVLSMHDETLYAERALRAGAMGYINKQEATTHVIDAIYKVLQGKVYLSERMTEKILAGLTKDGVEPPLVPLSNLSDRELEVFLLIGQGIGPGEIADRLHLSVKTIESHREKIKKKLGIQSATELNRRAMLWVVDNPQSDISA